MAKSVGQAEPIGDLVDRAFRDPGIKHGLGIFDPLELKKLPLAEEGGKVYVTCAFTGKKRLAKPEEIIRQVTVNKLADALRYPLGRIDIEVPLKMGAAGAA